MRKLRKPSPSLAISLLALFVALGGTTYAATGGNWILGTPNSATSRTSLSATIADRALQVTNLSTDRGSGGIGIAVATNKPPIVVSAGAGKAPNLNADKLDYLDSTDFLRNVAPLALSGSIDSDAVIAATNSGAANGVQGKSASASASGVYGENTGGGYGVAGRSNDALPAVYGDNTGAGPGIRGVSATGFGGDFDSLHTHLLHVGGPAHVSGAFTATSIQSSGALTSPQWKVTELVFCAPGCGPVVAGPLPRTSQSFATAGGTLMVFVSASAFADVDNTRPCVGATLDTDATTARSFCVFANNANVHLPLLTHPYVLTGIAGGNHTIKLEEFSSAAVMSTNVDDVYTVTVLELPF